MPRSGACNPYINGGELRSLPRVAAQIAKMQSAQNSGLNLSEEQVNAICAETAMAATDILYFRSGRVFSGVCGPVTIRPVGRPIDTDVRTWLGGGGAWGWGGSWGSTSYYGLGVGPVVSRFGSNEPPVVFLGAYPVNEIIQVLIDGVLIPPEEYTLRDYHTLVRIRPTPSYVPTERYGWPTSQIQDLPDTEMGTFSITYTYGQDPGEGGRAACRALAQALVLTQFGDTTLLPSRVTQVVRQGVTTQTADVVDILSKGLLGIYEVDMWIDSVNPNKATRQSMVYSPDIGRPRRMATPSVSGGT
jgi:hypothetical protein